jgi:heptosyltransferase-1
MEEPSASGVQRVRIPERVQSILIVKLSSIGDVVQSLPVAAALRRRFPGAYIAWAVKPAAADVVAGNPYLSETLVLGGQAARSDCRALPPLREPQRLARALRERRFELAIDMQGLFKTALVARLSGAPARIGFRNRQEGAFLLNNLSIVPDRRDLHAVEVYLGFAAAVGAPTTPVEFSIAISESDERAVDGLLGDRDNLVALIPGARWLSKRWTPAKFAAVADALADGEGCTSVVVGASSDTALAAEVAASAKAPILDLTGKTTLKQLAALFRRCRLVVSNETGPMYIASAMGTPTVAIFGPTDAERLGPYGSVHAKVVPDLPCRPCRRRTCQPLRCMEAIAPEPVVSAARRLLHQPSSGGDACQRASTNPA